MTDAAAELAKPIAPEADTCSSLQRPLLKGLQVHERRGVRRTGSRDRVVDESRHTASLRCHRAAYGLVREVQGVDLPCTGL